MKCPICNMKITLREWIIIKLNWKMLADGICDRHILGK